jgi:hypothetical protein
MDRTTRSVRLAAAILLMLALGWLIALAASAASECGFREVRCSGFLEFVADDGSIVLLALVGLSVGSWLAAVFRRRHE